MKCLHLISVIFLSSIIVFGCSKEDAVESCSLEGISSLDTNENILSCAYDQNGNLIEMIHGTGTKVVNFAYLNGKVSQVETSFNNSLVDSCKLDLYTYTPQGTIEKIEHQVANEADCSEFETFGNTTYIYNNDGELSSAVLLPTNNQNALQYDSIIHLFDNNRNIIRIERYLSGDIAFLSTFKYDDQLNPLQGYLNNGANNLKEESNVIYAAQQEVTFNFTYEYNELGIPIKAEKRSTLDIFAVEEWDYNLICR